jgi:hypothetical protein
MRYKVKPVRYNEPSPDLAEAKATIAALQRKLAAKEIQIAQLKRQLYG